MKVTYEEYNKKMTKMIKSKRFNKLEFSDKLYALLELAKKYTIYEQEQKQD